MDLQDGTDGVAMLSQAEGERVHAELKGAKGSTAVITKGPIVEAGDSCRKVQVKARTPEGRLVIVSRFLTNVGDQPVTPKYERAKATAKAQLDVHDTSQRLVIQIFKKHTEANIYDTMRKAPRAAIHEWVQDRGFGGDVLYMSMPAVKRMGPDDEWLEALMTVRNSKVDYVLRCSGTGGVFVKPFMTVDTDPQIARKVCWLEEGAKLSDAISRAGRYGDRAFGVVSGRQGLGIRVDVASFAEMARKLLPEDKAKQEIAREGQTLYELAKIPPWVDFLDLQTQLEATWEWKVELAREIRGWSTKTFLVRATCPPTRDAAVIDGHWIPVQAARPRKPQTPQRMRYRGHVGRKANRTI